MLIRPLVQRFTMAKHGPLKYQSENGIYEKNCGLDKIHLSFGHDEYIYQATRTYLPEEAQYMLRYHSFYPAHRDGAYQHLMNEQDERMFEWVRKFNQYDLYSKVANGPRCRKFCLATRTSYPSFSPTRSRGDCAW